MQLLAWLVVAIAGWLQRDQQAAIVYLLEENRVLKARFGGRKLRLTDDERHQRVRRLAGNSWQKLPTSSHRRPCWLGTEGSLRGSGTTARSGNSSDEQDKHPPAVHRGLVGALSPTASKRP